MLEQPQSREAEIGTMASGMVRRAVALLITLAVILLAIALAGCT